MLDRGPGDRKAVEGRGAAPDLVENDQRSRPRLVQDRCGLDHLDHEGRAPAGEIVGGADAREQPVDDADMRMSRRHEGAHLRQHGDQRILAQESRFTRHVWAGDQADPATLGAAAWRRQLGVVGDERLAVALQRRLDDRVATSADREGLAAIDQRATPALAAREFGQPGRDVDLGQRRSRALDRLGLGQNRLAQGGEDAELQLQRPVGRRGDLRFQPAELDGGEAHRVRHGLAVHEGRPPGLLQEILADGLRHLDEIAQHGVVLDAQRPAAGLGRVAGLQLRDHLARIDLQQTQLVQRRVMALAHEAPVAPVERQFLGQRRRQPRRQVGVDLGEGARGFRQFGRQGRPVEQHGDDGARRRQPRPSAARSRGPPRSSASRASARAMSGTRASAAWRSSRRAPSATSAATAS